jgi:predicted HicB family RNase H-like nuclease
VRLALMSAAGFPNANRTMNPRVKRGRPRSEFPGRCQVRHTPGQMLAWLAAAQRDGRTLQNWIRWTLDKAAKK